MMGVDPSSDAGEDAGQQEEGAAGGPRRGGLRFGTIGILALIFIAASFCLATVGVVLCVFSFKKADNPEPIQKMIYGYLGPVLIGIALGLFFVGLVASLRERKPQPRIAQRETQHPPAPAVVFIKH